MKTLRQHRFLTFTLCTALSLSSVGLPVIVVACGMGKVVMTKSCMKSCGEVSMTGRRITRPPCAIQIAFIERNTTAYLPTKPEANLSGLQMLLVLPPSPLSTGSISSGYVKPETSPPFIRNDIPILISSLLI